MQYGTIDGVYNGLSIALFGLVAGVVADRLRRRKLVAGTGYALSAGCKLLLVLAGGAWAWIMAILALDRLRKGIRTAPRDAMISLHTAESLYGTAFAVRRFLDSTGALLGPIVGFAVLAQVSGRFDVLWAVSFLIAALGVSALWLFVVSDADSERRHRFELAEESRERPAKPVLSRGFATLIACGTVLAFFTISDGFIYLLLQQKTGIAAGYVPLFFVATAAGYLLFALPLGVLADRHGRLRVFLSGYAILLLVYIVLLAPSGLPLSLQLVCLLLLGLYYAATEGVLMALASTMIPSARRATGLAVLVSCIGAGKLGSSIFLGWLWQRFDATTAVAVFGVGTMAVLAMAGAALRERHD